MKVMSSLLLASLGNTTVQVNISEGATDGETPPLVMLSGYKTSRQKLKERHEIS